MLAVGGGVSGIAPGDKVLYRKEHAVDVRLPPAPVVLVQREDVIARYVD